MKGRSGESSSPIFPRPEARVPLEKSAKVGRVLKAEVEGQPGHGRRDVYEPAAGFARKSGVDQGLGVLPRLVAYHPVEPVGRESQLLGIARDGPVLSIVRLQQRHPTRVMCLSARDVSPRGRLRIAACHLRQPPDDGAGKPQGHRAIEAVGCVVFGMQRFEQGLQPRHLWRRGFQRHDERRPEEQVERDVDAGRIALGEQRRVEGQDEAVAIARETERMRDGRRNRQRCRTRAAAAKTASVS